MPARQASGTNAGAEQQALPKADRDGLLDQYAWWKERLGLGGALGRAVPQETSVQLSQGE